MNNQDCHAPLHYARNDSLSYSQTFIAIASKNDEAILLIIIKINIKYRFL